MASEDDNEPPRTLGFISLTRAVASEWKALSPASRRPYEVLAEREKNKYNVALLKWKKSVSKRQRDSDPLPTTPTQISSDKNDESFDTSPPIETFDMLSSIESMNDIDRPMARRIFQSLRTSKDTLGEGFIDFVLSCFPKQN